MRRTLGSAVLLVSLAALALVLAPTAPAVERGSASERGADADPVIVAVGDLACQSLSMGDGEGACRSDEVADLITSIEPTRFLALGDLQYNNGTPREFARVWDVQFGHLSSIIAPAPGNHEYGTEGAQGYFDYFGPISNPGVGYYSFDLGSWHIVSLNSDICGDDPGCGPGTPQYDWLEADLSDHDDAACTLAFQHHPRFDWRPYQKWIEDDGTTQYGGSETRPYVKMVKLMDAAGVDVLLVGHNHIYQRWAPQDGAGNLDPNGVRQFTVGTGGRSLYSFGPKPRPTNLRATQNKAFGVLKMTLHADTYDFEWLPVPGEPSFTDAGSGVACT